MKVTYIDHMGTDLSVVNAARVSFGKKSDWEYDVGGSGGWHNLHLKLKDEMLVKYLAHHAHFSPFNHTFLTMHVKAPIFVARQLVKHEYMPWNEISRRYVEDTPEFYEMNWRARPPKSIKQGSGEELTIEGDLENTTVEAVSASLRAYEALLGAGVAPEQARALLPQNMYTEWYWSGTLKAWAKMYKLRIDAHAQKETQDVARQVGDIIAPLFPVSWKYLKEANL